MVWNPLIDLGRNLAVWIASILPTINLGFTVDLSVFAGFWAAASDFANALVDLTVLKAVLVLMLALFAVDYGWGLLMAAYRRIPLIGH